MLSLASCADSASCSQHITFCCCREAKYLQRMGTHVPEVACTLLLQEEKFKFYFAQLSHLVSCPAHPWPPWLNVLCLPFPCTRYLIDHMLLCGQHG